MKTESEIREKIKVYEGFVDIATPEKVISKVLWEFAADSLRWVLEETTNEKD